MGIYGALSTAVTGLRAQSFALENVSGNIANSQTTGFKRIDTDFVDLIPDAATKRQTAGSVLAQSRSTNNVQGDVKGTSTETNMAINGNGFFVVEPAIGQSDGSAVFSGANFYTRRGDFELDKSGYLVNGAGYFLKGLPIDPQTQNISGSVPQVLQISNAFLPAHQTTRVNYEINLPQLPKTPQYNQSQTPGSELLDPRDFLTDAQLANLPHTPATASGVKLTDGTAAASTIASAGDTLKITVNGTAYDFSFVSSLAGLTATNAVVAGTSALASIDLIGTPAVPTNAVATGASALASLDASGGDITFEVNGQLVTLASAGGAGGIYDAAAIRDAINTQAGASAQVQASIDGSGNLVVTSTGTAGAADAVTIDTFSAGVDATDLGFAGAAVLESGSAGTAVPAADLSFNVNGQPVTLAGGSAYTPAQIRDAINTQVGTSANVNASLDGSGNLVITSTGTASAADSVVVDGFSSGNASQLGFAASASVSDNGTDGAAGTYFDVSAPPTNTVDGLLAAIQGGLPSGMTVGRAADGSITVSAASAADVIAIADSTTGTSGAGFGLPDDEFSSTISAAAARGVDVEAIAAKDVDEFFAQSISGGAITVYAGNGAPANVQMRWAKVTSTENGGAEQWNLFILTNANAVGTGTAWARVGGDYTFGTDGSPNPAVDYTDLGNLTVNGVTVGNVRLQHGSNGLTQFADPNGVAEVTTLNQNGYAAGEYVSVAVNDNGRVVVSYNNGQQLEVAQVVTANFNAVNQLKRMDGGVFAATSESGEPILDNGGGIIGSSLEASNTDISEEFTKLIVTQQAYAAGTRIVSTADQMLQDALNMIR